MWWGGRVRIDGEVIPDNKAVKNGTGIEAVDDTIVSEMVKIILLC